MRFMLEIRNGDNNFLGGFKGPETPHFVEINPMDVEGTVNRAMRNVLPKTVDKISSLLGKNMEAPKHD